jgi:predicted AlkP superfamily pyrophosphatase or phosphodiesterase
VESAIRAAERWRPDFFYVYVPHLDYAAQRSGPESAAAGEAVGQLDDLLERLLGGFRQAYDAEPIWLVAGEYAITPVEHVSYPNRVLREAGLLAVREEEDGEHLDPAASRAWAMVDHQFSHVFIDPDDPALAGKVADVFRREPGIAEVLVGEQLARYGLDHERSGEVVLVSEPESWQAYYWWTSDDRAPAFARTVDIHRKPGYDPVELHFDRATRSIPLDATLVQGSHGAPAVDAAQRSVIGSSRRGVLGQRARMVDTDVFDVVMRQLGVDLT